MREPARERIQVWRPGGVEIELHRGLGVVRSVPPHWHEEYQLCLVQDGAGELLYRGGRHANPAWSLFVVHPGEVHSNRATVAEGCSYRAMNVHPDLLAGALAEVAGRNRGLPFFPVPVLLEGGLLRRFLTLHELLERPAGRLETDGALLDTLVRLVERHAQDAPAVRPAGREGGAAARARDFLEAHYADEVSLADLARLAGLSRYYLSRVFRRAYGLPPHAYQVQLRIAHARRLLRLGRPPAEVAATTGFADQSHFHRRFTSIVGVTPASYREGKNVQDRPARQA